MTATIYHVTPITPDTRLEALKGRHFMVSHYHPQQTHLMDAVAAGVCWENGAFSIHTEMLRLRKRVAAGEVLSKKDMARLLFLEQPRDWRPFYRWVEEDDRLFKPGRWAIIPDAIAMGGQAQDALIKEWPHGHRGAPVYHMGEPIERLLRLLDSWPRVCIGSTDDFWRIWLPGLHGKVLDPVWEKRMTETWEAIVKRHPDPVIHMLRGTALCHLFPFFSADSSSVGQNSHRYTMPLFAGTDAEFEGVIAYANKLERRSDIRA